MPRSRAEWDEELAAGMLEDLEQITGISIGEMLADELETPSDEEADFEIFPIHEEPTESEPLDDETDFYGDTDDYFDALFDDLDVDLDDSDAYKDDNNG